MLKNKNELFSRGHLFLFLFLFYFILFYFFFACFCRLFVFNIEDTDICAPKSGGLIWVHTVYLYTYIDQ